MGRPSKYSDHFLDVRKDIPNTDISGIELKEVKCKNERCQQHFKTLRVTALSYCTRMCAEQGEGFTNRHMNKQTRNKIKLLANTEESDETIEVYEHDEEGVINEIIGKTN